MKESEGGGGGKKERAMGALRWSEEGSARRAPLSALCSLDTGRNRK